MHSLAARLHRRDLGRPCSPVNYGVGSRIMNELQIEARKAKGKEIAERFKILETGGVWIVPSSKSARKRYEVTLDPTNASCTCPDHAETGQKCKHIYAVEHMLRGQ